MDRPTWQERAASWLRPAIDFVYPPCCAACGGSTGATVMLCAACRTDLRQPPGERCQRCGAPVGPRLDTATGCGHCRAETFAFRRVWALGHYHGPLASACRQGKQAWGQPLVLALADLLWDTYAADLLTERIDALTCIPCDWWRRMTRGGQAPVVLAQRLAWRMQRPFIPHVLVKPRWTPLQTRVPPSVRRRQQRGAFRVPPGINLTGTRLLLVDDVLTTGATAQAAARALRAAGAADVLVAVLARGVGQHTV